MQTEFHRCIETMSKRERISNTVLGDIKNLLKVLELIRGKSLHNMVDLGCGLGVLTKCIGKYLGIKEVLGIEINETKLSYAKSIGINTLKLDLNADTFPFEDGSYDLVTSFGAIEHLIFYDNLVSESYRILRKNGYMILVMPNLASYINRVGLLFGYQPRSVEVSNRYSPGCLRFLKYGYDKRVLGYYHVHDAHIHSATLKAMKELVTEYGFNVIKVRPISPIWEHQKQNTILKIADKLFSMWPGWSRRFIMLLEKP